MFFRYQEDTRKKDNINKYPWMKDVIFIPFPTKAKNKKLRLKWLEMIRRPREYDPPSWHMVCRLHFSDPSSTSLPVLFPWNTDKTNARSSASIEKREAFEFSKKNLVASTSTPDQVERPHYDLTCYEDLEESQESCSHGIDILPYQSVSPVTVEVEISTSNPDNENVTNTVIDHDYSICSKTDMTGGDIICLENKAEKLEQKLDNKDEMLRELFVEKVIKSDKSLKYFTGLPNLDVFNCISDITSQHESNLKYWRGSDSADQKNYQQTGKKPGPKRKLSHVQELVITLLRLRLALPLYVLAVIFGVSTTRISSIFTTWIFYLYFLFKDQIKWPSRNLVNRHMPSCFRKSFPRTRAIIDCTEIFIQRPRNPSVHSKTYSNYKSHNTFKFLVSITPTGAINFISKIWGGNTSDRFLTANSGFLDLISPGDEIMADRGFTIRDLLTERRAYLTMSPFTRKCAWGKGKRWNVNEIRRTRKIADLRIHVERAIQRMKTFKMISQIIPWSMKSVLNPMVTVIGFFCNLLRPLVKKQC